MSPCSTLTASLRCLASAEVIPHLEWAYPVVIFSTNDSPLTGLRCVMIMGFFFPAGSSLAVMKDIPGYASRKHSQNFKPNSTISPSSINLDLLQCLEHFLCYSSLLNHHLQNSPNQASFNATSTRGPHPRQV